MSFLIPNFSPKTITDLTSQAEEEPALAKKEAELKAQVRSCVKASLTCCCDLYLSPTSYRRCRRKLDAMRLARPVHKSVAQQR